MPVCVHGIKPHMLQHARVDESSAAEQSLCGFVVALQTTNVHMQMSVVYFLAFTYHVRNKTVNKSGDFWLRNIFAFTLRNLKNEKLSSMWKHF